jgi:hypothetical protein|tara:strand:+ start:431 stop:913 length:483 start_codon:yes stop_codon:yes gene_type:complete
MRTVTIISVNKPGKKTYQNFDSQSNKWNVVERKDLEEREGIYTRAGLKNHEMKNVTSDYILWLEPEALGSISEVQQRAWTLDTFVQRTPYQATALLVPTEIQLRLPWRNIEAQDYDMRLRILAEGHKLRSMERVYSNNLWFTNAFKIQEAYLNRDSFVEP